MRVLDAIRGALNGPLDELPRATPGRDATSSEADRYWDRVLDAIRDQAQAQGRPWGLWNDWNDTALPFAREVIRSASPRARAELLVAACARAPDRGTWLEELPKSQLWMIGVLVRDLLRRKIELDEGQLVAVLDHARRSGSHFPVALPGLKQAVEAHLRAHPAAPALRERLGIVLDAIARLGPAGRRDRRKLEELLNGPGVAVEPEAGEPWSDLARADLAAMASDERAHWSALLHHGLGIATAARAPAAWRREARSQVQAIGVERFAATFTRWSDAVRCPRELRPRAFPALGFLDPISTTNGDLLKGLVWSCADVAEADVDLALGRLAETSLKKIPAYGPLCRKLGNACIQTLGERGSRAALAELQRLAQRVKHRQAKQLIEKTLDAAAERAGLARDDLDDLAAPHFDLDAAGVAAHDFGVGRAEIRLAGACDVELRWAGADGKPRASVPKALRDAHPDAPKRMRALAKLVGETLRAQRDRVEAGYERGRSWTFASWRERWLAHPLLAHLATRLVWEIESGGEKTVVSAAGGVLQDVGGREASPAGDATLRLWHPLGADVATITRWRERLRALGVTQPFKQAHRELYVVTPPERLTRTYSNRFAAHILRQHQLASLLHARGWCYALQGNFDGGNVPTKQLPGGWSAEFAVDPVPQPLSESYIFLFVQSNQVRFRDERGRAVELDSVPPLLFSETMREVDLFVSVASIGNDPNWVDRGEDAFREYCVRYAEAELVESARTRRAVLEELLPLLSIAGRCRLLERWLEVRGAYSTYRIHLVSGNVQMEPGSRYLCIVPDSRSRTGEVTLPFEGDAMLSLILSKAFLLADDEHIRDRSILAQIHRH